MKTSSYRSDTGARARLAGAAIAAVTLIGGLAQSAAASSVLQASDITVREGSEANFTIALLPSATVNFDFRYAYQTEDGTAKDPEDYVGASGHVVFLAGVRSVTVNVSTKRDYVDEPEETFSLRLYNMETRGLARGSSEWTSDFAISSLPSEKTVYATIHEDTYESEKYGSGYSGSTFGE